MNRFYLWLADRLSLSLPSHERDAVRGDLLESGETASETLRQILGLAARREAARWLEWRPWAVLVASAVIALYITPLSRRTADHSAIYFWLYANNWTAGYLGTGLLRDAVTVLATYGQLVLLAAAAGFALGLIARRPEVLCAALIAAEWFAAPASLARNHPDNAAVFVLAFYSTAFPIIVQAVLVAFPALLGMRLSRRFASIPRLAHAVAVFLIATTTAAAADGIRVPLQSAETRKPAPALTLKDSSGKTMKLQQYRGKIVLLDFWATWCHGCKEEIPWFTEFSRKYESKGLKVVGVSLDGDGWKVLKPFLKTANIPYRIILGDDPTANRYGIETMPDTFLIDREGRIAAAYRGMVDRDDIEQNIRALLRR
jgi:cytochrome c biogenesis protein CcmG/thiol:disulfide interchange protein DsbE